MTQPARFVPLDDAVRFAMNDLGEVNQDNYPRFLQWGLRALQELTADVLNRTYREYLPVNSSKQARLPDNYVNWVRCGLVNQSNEVIDLAYDPNLVTAVYKATCHCGSDCGCTTPEVCELPATCTVEQVNQVLPTPTRVVDWRITPYFDYNLCTYAWEFVPQDPVCNYTYDFNLTEASYPITINSQVIDGVDTPIDVTYPDWTSLEAALALSPNTQIISEGVFIIGATTVELGAYNISTADGTFNIDPEIRCESCSYEYITGAVADICTYSYDFTGGGIVYPTEITSYQLNGIVTADGTVVGDEAAVDEWMEAQGFTTTGTLAYTITTADVWGKIQMPGTGNPNPTITDCSGGNFPVTLTSYTKNGQVIPDGTTFNYMYEMDAYMSTLGFTGSNGTYTSPVGPDIYGEMILDFSGAPSNILPTETCEDTDFPLTIISYTMNGTIVPVNQTFEFKSELDAFLETIGFAEGVDQYETTGSYNAFGLINYSLSNGEEQQMPFVSSDCTVIEGSFNYPFWIRKISTDGNVSNCNVLIPDQTARDAYFAAMGFTPDGEDYIAIDSSTQYDFLQFADPTGMGSYAYFIPETVEIQTIDTTYEQTTQICTDGCGGITKKVCAAGYVTVPEKYDWQIELANLEGIFPATALLTVDGGEVSQDCDDIYDLADFLEGYGLVFLNVDAFEEDPLFYATQTEYGFGALSVGGNEYVFELKLTYPTTEVEENVCIETVVCPPSTKECGCVEVSDAVINTLYDCGLLNNQIWQRYWNGSDIDQVLQQSKNKWGYFKVDADLGVIQLNPTYAQDSIYFEYYGTGSEGKGGSFLIPVLSTEAIAAFIRWKFVQNKRSATIFDKQDARKRYMIEKNNLRDRITPFRVSDYLFITRMGARP